MTPSQKVAKLYWEWPQPRTFAEDIRAHMTTGYVISTPDLFVMGRGIDRYADPELIAEPWHEFANPNTWLVYAFAGRVKTILDFIPHSHHWIGFQRRGKPIRYYDFKKLLRSIRQAG